MEGISGKMILYYDGYSQPCRALYMFLKLNNIDFEIKQISVVKGETTSAEYLAKNPYGAVPCIDDEGFVLPESVAIFKYLCNKHGHLPDHWYPKDLQKRARIDQYLAWQHGTIRRHGTWIMLEKCLIFSTEPFNQKKYDQHVKGLKAAIKKFEDLYLGDHTFIFGENMSIADLLAVAELVQAIAGQYGIQKNHPKTFAYMERVKARTQPYYDECFRRILYEGDRVAEGKCRLEILPNDPNIL